MLGAIYAWRRNGGMRWPRYERSDAIMDLRAASRTSNSLNIALASPLLILPSCAQSRSVLDRWNHRALSAPPLQPPVRPVTPTAKPGSQLSPREQLSARRNRSPSARKKRVLSIIWSDALCNVRHLSSEGRYLFHACTVYLSCRALTGTPLAASRRRPTGFCLPQGLWHSHRPSQHVLRV